MGLFTKIKDGFNSVFGRKQEKQPIKTTVPLRDFYSGFVPKVNFVKRKRTVVRGYRAKRKARNKMARRSRRINRLKAA